MARSIENTLTLGGLALISRSLAETKPVIFSRAAIGTGVAPDAADLKTYTDLLNTYDNAVIAGKKVDSSNNLVITINYWNTGVQEAVQIDEIGLFCKLEGDVSDVLFSYMTLGQYADTIFPASQATSQRTYDLPYVFNNSESATVNIVPSTLLAASDATTTPQAGKLLRVNSDGKLDVDITGDALTLGGHSSTYFAVATHRHDNATTSADGFMSKEDKAAHNLLVSRVDQALNMDSIPTFNGAVINGYIDNAMFR